MKLPNWPSNADGDALRRVAKHGSDLSKPMTIDFSVAVPGERSGMAIAELANERGYKTKVVRDDDSGEWTCYCTKFMLATYDGVIEAQRELATLAESHGGHPDGWGTFGNVETADGIPGSR